MTMIVPEATKQGYCEINGGGACGSYTNQLQDKKRPQDAREDKLPHNIDEFLSIHRRYRDGN